MMVAEAFEKVRAAYSAVFSLFLGCMVQPAAAAAASSGHDGGRGL
jgi:hypothetical protein